MVTSDKIKNTNHLIPRKDLEIKSHFQNNHSDLDLEKTSKIPIVYEISSPVVVKKTNLDCIQNDADISTFDSKKGKYTEKIEFHKK